ncbi:MAG: type I DNA topoisomerase [Acidimicrobiales bacterium]|jgi:DNA topoisomerase-1
MPKPLVIVESPAKAKTIAGYLGGDYVVESSIGHIRDLPRSAADVPAAFKQEPWARLGVDVDNDFKPLYVVSREKKEQVAKLRRLVGAASEVYLATDEDREGESIAWHLVEVLSPRVPVSRMVFHEITPSAIRAAIEHPRELDRRLVDAQEARRILDRLYGYEVSPVLWRKVAKGLSAGRVQSVATRIVVERERERMRFRSASWCSVEGSFAAESQPFAARLVEVGDRRVATGEDFSPTGTLSSPDEVVLLDEPAARGIVAALQGADFEVSSVEERPYRRSPAAPFITSTLQQEAARKLRFSAQRTMQVAQRLYERGYITYMRTDSTTLSDTAIRAAREQAQALYGAQSVPRSPRVYRSKVKNAQEAHEAIRPAGDRFRTPAQISGELRGEERSLYELVWQRTVASQMNDATGTTARARIQGRTFEASPVAPKGSATVFMATGTVITDPGFLAVYREDEDENGDGRGERRGDQDVRLPRLVAGGEVDCDGLEVEEHATKPPARYTEASLVRRLEELGVGRPSTYASIIGTIQDRGYVWKRGTALVPSFTAFAVVGLLEDHFANLVDYGFTASMEDDLDDIASGSEEQVPWLERFYFGEQRPGAVRPARAAGHSLAVDGSHGLKEAVSLHLDEIDAREVNSIPLATDAEGREIVIRVGRYGPYLQRGEERAAVPGDLAPDELTRERAEELLEHPSTDRVLGTDPLTGKTVLVRAGRFGPYVQLGEAATAGDKPRTASLLKTMSVPDVTLEQALQILQLPRTIGADPETGEEIVAANGRFGPFMKRGSETRSLETEDQLFTVTIEEALSLFSAPKQRRYGTSAAPLRELGADPETGSAIVLRSGRFGPYVSDGTTNASLRRGDDPEELTLERALELISERRAAGPARRAGTRKATGAAKKAGARKTTTSKKTAARKATARKATATKKAPARKATATANKAPARKATATKKAAAAKKATVRRAPGAAIRTAGPGSVSQSDDDW